MKYFCPICGKRICDSSKTLTLSLLSQENEDDADIALKCRICKNKLALFVVQSVAPQGTSPY